MKNKFSSRIPPLLMAAAAFFCLLSNGLFYFMETALFLGIFAFLLLILYRKNPAPIPSKLFFFLCVLFGGLVLLPFYTSMDALQTVRMLVPWLLFGIAVLLGLSNAAGSVLKGVYLSILVAALLGLAGYFHLSEGFSLAGWADGIWELQSVFGYSNTAALFFGIGIFLSTYYFEQTKKWRYLYGLLLCTVSLYFTGSKFAAVFFFIAYLLYFALRFPKFRPVFFGLFILSAGALFLLPVLGWERNLFPSTLASRLIYWQDGLVAFIRHPLGIGFENWGFLKGSIQTADYTTNYLHNSFLQILVEQGPFVFIALLMVLIYTIRNLVLRFRKQKDSFDALLLCIAIFIILHSSVDINFSFGISLFVLGFITGYSGRTAEDTLPKSFSGGRMLFTLFCISCILISAGSAAVQHFESARPKTEEFYLHKIKTDFLSEQELSYLFSLAYGQNNAEAMYWFSSTWLRQAPRRQTAYDACFVSLDRMYQKTKDEFYLEQKRLLFQQVNQINQTMNPLVKYLDKNNYIYLPDET